MFPVLCFGQDQISLNTDKRPEFVGGMQKLYEYLGKNIRYPEVAKENGIQGTVYVKFVVWKDGTIRDVKVVKVKNSREERIENIKKEISEREHYKSYLSFFQFNEKRKIKKHISHLKSKLVDLESRQLKSNYNPNYKPIKDEAIRVIKAMPKWIPGEIGDKAVNALFTLPIKFRIS